MKKEIKTKGFLFILTFLFLFSFLNSALVLADEAAISNVDANQIEQQTKDMGKIMAALFIGPFKGAMEYIFGTTDGAIGTRGLFFVLLFLVIWTIVPYVFPGSSKWMSGSISFIIAILASISIPPSFLEAVLVQYGAMGATMLTVIPFLIIATWSMITPSALGARVIWLFYAFYYLGMYLYKTVFVTASVSGAPVDGTTRLLYLLAFAIGIFLFFGIKPIREIWMHGKLDALDEEGKRYVKTKRLLKKLNQAEAEAYGSS